MEDLVCFVIFPCTIDNENKTFKVQIHKIGQRNNKLTSLISEMLIGISEVQFLSEGLLALILPEKIFIGTLAKRQRC